MSPRSENRTPAHKESTVQADSPASAWAPLAAFLIPLFVYSATLAPTVTLEDSAEYTSVARVLGLAHPPGAPTWTLLGHLATYIPLGAVPARTNFLSALCGAGASLFLFLWLTKAGLFWSLSLSAALTGAFSRCVWGQSVVTEVYSMNLFFLFLCLFLASKWRETENRRWFWATALAGGLGAGVHHLLILLSPVVLWWAGRGRWRRFLETRTWLGAVVALGVGFSVHLYLPIRDHAPIAWESIDTFRDFSAYFTRELYKEAEGGIWTQGKFGDALQFLGAFFTNLPRELGGLIPLFAVPGWIALWKTRGDLCAALSAIVVLNVPVLLLAAGTSTFTPTSEFINRFYYLPAVAAIAALAAVGWFEMGRVLTRRFGLRMPRSMRGPLLAVIPIFPLILNWSACDRSDYRIADEYARNLLRSLEVGDAVFPLTNNETFLLLYFDHVAEDRRAFLLDERFGWDGRRPPRRIYTAWDVGASAVNPLTAVFGERETVPETILHRLLESPSGEGLDRLRTMRPLELKIRTRPSDFPNLSPFERMIFAAYSAYHARLGGAYRLVGREELADSHWRKAEELNPPDAFCHYLLGTLYEAFGREGAEDHYAKALEVFPISHDPLDTRFYSVSLETIEEKVRSFRDLQPDEANRR